jgi:hypothetical protein
MDNSKKTLAIAALAVVAVLVAGFVIFKTVWQPLPPAAGADKPMDMSKEKAMKNQPPGGFE